MPHFRSRSIKIPQNNKITKGKTAEYITIPIRVCNIANCLRLIYLSDVSNIVGNNYICEYHHRLMN